MRRHHDSAEDHSPSRESVRIAVSDFGPISEGSIVLRPLTVFVGPSNAGKTYLATLIYCLHRIFAGFKQPFGEDWTHEIPFHQALSREISEQLDKTQILKLFKHISNEKQEIMWSHLPDTISRPIIQYLESGDLGLSDELARCFDLRQISQLIRSSSQSHNANVSVSVNLTGLNNWNVTFVVSEEEVRARVKIENVVLARGERFRRRYFDRAWLKHEMLSRNQEELEFWMRSNLFPRILDQLFFRISRHFNRFKQNSIHYLPAARSGIMQSHRVIASSLVSRSTRAGVERFKEIPTFSGALADFMGRLLLFKQRHATEHSLGRIAESLELETLAGRIIEKSEVPGVYPEFVYQPTATKQDIRLSRASSMVSELAPIVLFLRGVVDSNSTVIIEEPEAHLHPAAQTQIAVTLARMVRAGLRVVVTTHSDWLLQEIANLIREGLVKSHDDQNPSQILLPKYLQQDEVGVWLFRCDEASSTIEEIPFDTSEGVEPREYEDVAEQLYNRSANLQNRIEEMKS